MYASRTLDCSSSHTSIGKIDWIDFLFRFFVFSSKPTYPPTHSHLAFFSSACDLTLLNSPSHANPSSARDCLRLPPKAMLAQAEHAVDSSIYIVIKKGKPLWGKYKLYVVVFVVGLLLLNYAAVTVKPPIFCCLCVCSPRPP